MVLKYFSNPVKCGFPSPAMDYMEESIDLNELLIKNRPSTFIVENIGDSMVDAFIPPKAKLIVDRSLTPKNWDVVLVVLNGDFTVKYFKKSDFKCWLIPANKKYSEIEVTSEMDFQVWGVVTYVISETKVNRICTL